MRCEGEKVVLNECVSGLLVERGRRYLGMGRGFMYFSVARLLGLDS